MATGRKAPIPFPLPEDLSGHEVGRFVVHHKLGSGGMGEVYYAEDTKLQKPVALKRVTPALGTRSDIRQRILREARRASALSSDHIVNVYDVIEDSNEIFLVMEYVEGVTLRHLLVRKRRLPVDAFLPLAVQCAEALVEAQRKGIVHRDIKPENIMLTPSGHVKVLDFGLAQRVMVADPNALTASMDTSGGLAGTPGYMAPEALLEEELDTRVDIFSLGVVFYEMLTGRHPFETHKRITTADHILHDQPLPMRTLAEDVPNELDRIVFKMLAKHPEDRYATAADLLVDLRAVQRGAAVRTSSPRAELWRRIAGRHGFVLALAAILLIAPMMIKHWKLWPGEALPKEKALAVLPFYTASNDPDVRAFSYGITETLTTKLSQVRDRFPQLRVVPADEIRKYLQINPTAPLDQLRGDLAVNLVLEGSLHRSGERLRINCNVVDARTKRVLRADTITAAATDSFALEDRVVDSALRALDLELGSEERQHLAVRGTNEPAAYDFYLRGRGYLQDYQKPENIDSAIEVFQRALDYDPKFSLACAALGESYWKKYEFTHNSTWIDKALEACQRASAGASGHSCLGTIYNGTGKYEEAAAEFQRVLQTDPNDQDGYHGLAVAYAGSGKPADAERTYRKAIAVRPEYWGGYSWLGAFYYGQGRYNEAAGMFAQVVALAPDNARGYSNLCGAYIMAARYAEAVPVCEHSATTMPTQDAYSNLGTAYFYQRRFPDAASAYEQAIKLDDRQRSSWGNLGDAYYWTAGRRRDSKPAYHRALALGEQELRVNPRSAHLLSYLAVYHAMLQDNRAAAADLRRALDLSTNDAEILLNAALVANQLEDANGAIRFLVKAVEAGISPALILSNPNFDKLYSHKQFQELVQQKKSAGF